jgi:VanZ family protein
MEHYAINLAMAVAFAIGYRDRLIVVAGGLPLFCGLIEIAQLWVPGHHVRLSDFLVDAAAGWIGVAAAIGAKLILPRSFEQRLFSCRCWTRQSRFSNEATCWLIRQHHAQFQL